MNDADLFAAAVEVANVPTLLAVLVQLTGDMRWLEEPYRPERGKVTSDNDTGGLAPEIQAEIRAAACDALVAWRAGRPVAIADPSEAFMLRVLSVSMGESIPEEYGPLLVSELAATVKPETPSIPTPPPVDFEVAIVGAGAAGLCAGVLLKQAGIRFTIFERNASVGGTWWENSYPGAAVDTPNYLYSFTFLNHDWSRYFAGQPEIMSYLEDIAEEFSLHEDIRLSTEVRSVTYNHGTQRWTIETENSLGQREVRSVNAVISAVGIFNPPTIPDIKGLETFSGPSFHTARWDSTAELVGKRVAVIGNGASAMQVVPAIADEVASLTVFQRSAHWIAEFEQFQKPVPDPVRFLLREVPLYRAWYRLRLVWIWNDRAYMALQKDPSWPHPDRSLNALNDAVRRVFTRYLMDELGDRPDLVEALLPTYPPFGKRLLLDNGWFKTLKRSNVELVTDSISEIRPEGIVTASGVEYETDVIILATGFDVVHFITSYDVVGRSGRTLQETWGDDAKAYLGMHVPDFPNFFCLYGPNTQPGHGGSILPIIEWKLNYLIDLFTQMFEQNIAVVECRPEVHAEYNDTMDKMHAGMVGTHPGMRTYTRNSRGRVVSNTPFRNVDIWNMLRSASLDDYLTELPVEDVAPNSVG